MKRQTALDLIALICLLAAEIQSQPVLVYIRERSDARTTLPLLLLLSYRPQVGVPIPIPIRRPLDEPTITRQPPVQSDEPVDANAQIREQFLQGILQGLQSTEGGVTVPPAVLADVLQQVQTTKTTTTTTTTRAPKTMLEEVAKEPNSNDNDPDYDYIDFKNGSRIKYELDNDQQLNNSQFANKRSVRAI